MEVHNNSLAEVEEKKKKIRAEISSNYGDRFDDLIKATENMRLEIISSKEVEIEKNKTSYIVRKPCLTSELLDSEKS